MIEENPYQSPIQEANIPENVILTVDLVQRGRNLCLVIAFALFMIELLPTLFFREQYHIYRMTYLGILLIAMWRGHGWAITFLALGLGLGLLLAIPFFIAAVMHDAPLVMLFVFVSAIIYGVILTHLFNSDSLNAFFKHQEQQRQPKTMAEAMQNNRLNVVTLTPAAAELARRVIAEQNYQPDTALRIVMGTDWEKKIEIQYDLPPHDDHDWIGESAGMVILVAKDIAPHLEGITIDAREGQFLVK